MVTIESPLELGSLELSNRLAKSAMSERLADRDGAPNEALITLYEVWARSGAGLLVTGNVMVDRRAIGERGNVIVEDDRHARALAAWAQAAKSGGASVWAQINHPGRQAPRDANRGSVAPSAVPLAGAGRLAFSRPRALEAREIEEIVDRFGRTAAALVSAGFDGVQIHAAHGYLINQFLSPLTNRRDDAWGGDPDRRRRFLLEIVRRVRSGVGPRVAVGVKLNSADFQRGGFTEDESMAVVEALEAERIDLLEVSGGTYETATMFSEPSASTRAREAFFLEYAEKVRRRVKTPILLTGGFRSRAGMDAALGSSAIDVVGLARPLAVEPDLPARLLRGDAQRAADVRLPPIGDKRLDAAIQAGFYQTQIRRIASGLEPDRSLGRLASLYRFLAPLPVPRPGAADRGARVGAPPAPTVP
ncbi:MAG: NADH:flavin oxidoreductase/NADH oxidase family protein [Myxococcales bacterium]|nr:NADH:flavin oxidoreductase/NADH oxidase family protein [Myxococcales bacterium]